MNSAIRNCETCGVEGEIRCGINLCEICNCVKCNECDKVEVNEELDMGFCSKCYNSEHYEKCINYWKEKKELCKCGKELHNQSSSPNNGLCYDCDDIWWE